jgi:hypothetical protein
MRPWSLVTRAAITFVTLSLALDRQMTPRSWGVHKPRTTALASLGIVLLLAGCGGGRADTTVSATATAAAVSANATAAPSPSQTVMSLKSIPLDLCRRFTAVELSSMMVSGSPAEAGDGISEKDCMWLSTAGGDLSLLTVKVNRLPDRASAQDLYAKNRAAADAQYAGAAKSSDLNLAQPAATAYLQVYSIPGPDGSQDGVAAIGVLDSNLVYDISLQAPGSEKARVSAVKAAFGVVYVA